MNKTTDRLQQFRGALALVALLVGMEIVAAQSTAIDCHFECTGGTPFKLAWQSKTNRTYDLWIIQAPFTPSAGFKLIPMKSFPDNNPQGPSFTLLLECI